MVTHMACHLVELRVVEISIVRSRARQLDVEQLPWHWLALPQRSKSGLYARARHCPAFRAQSKNHRAHQIDESLRLMISPSLRAAACAIGVLGMAFSGAAAADTKKASAYYENALLRVEKKDLAGAVVQLKNAIQEDSKLLAAQLLLGKTLFRLGELKGAEVALLEAQRLGVDRAEVVLTLGQIYILEGEPKQVIDKIQPTNLPPPLQAEVLALRGTAYANDNNTLAATRSFAEARALAPNSATPLAAEAMVLLRGGKAQEAKALTARAVELAPKDSIAWSTHASVLLAGKDFANALLAADNSLALDGQNTEARVTRAALRVILNQPAEALKDLDALAETQVDDPRADYLRAQLAVARGDVPAAKTALRDTALKVDALPKNYIKSREDLLMAGALAHHALRNWEKATEYLDIITKLSSRNLVARKLAASVAMEVNDTKRAVLLLEAMVKEQPDDAQLQFMLGSAYLSTRQYEKASDLLEKAVRNGYGNANRELGLSQIALGKGVSGIAYLEKALAANPGNDRGAMELAMVYLQNGQAKRAVEVADGVVKRNPKNLAARNFLGSVKAKSGDATGARAEFLQVLALDPAFRVSILNLARLESAQGRFDEGRARLTKLLSAHPDDGDALFELGTLESKARAPQAAARYFQKASDIQRTDPRPGMAWVEMLLQSGDSEQALRVAKRLETTFTDNAPVKMLVSRCLRAMGDLPGARAALDAATRLSALDADAQVRIGHLQLETANPEGAVDNAQRALKVRPGDEAAMVLLVQAYTMRGATAQADAAFKQLSETHPGTVLTLQAGANLAMVRGQYRAAATGYQAMLAKEPSSTAAISLVQAYVAAGDNAKATQFLDDWTKKNPADATALKALAEMRLRNGELDAASKTYRKILALEPEDPLTLNNLAGVLLKLNDPKALEAAEKAYKLQPRIPEVGDTLGWVLVQKGDASRGLLLLREARLRSPENTEIRFHLAYALAKTGRKAEAKEELQAALNAKPKIDMRAEVVQLKTELGL
jgi:putative PEP-CTERM system TPR-repeat lipoprotein